MNPIKFGKLIGHWDENAKHYDCDAGIVKQDRESGIWVAELADTDALCGHGDSAQAAADDLAEVLRRLRAIASEVLQ